MEQGKEKIEIVVTTSNKYMNSTLPGFLYLFKKFWHGAPDPKVLAESNAEFPGCEIFIIKDWPAERWSDGLIGYLSGLCRANYVILLMEDLWMNAPFDWANVITLVEYMRKSKAILRMDLTCDRWKSGRAREVGKWGRFDIIETPPDTPYQMSLQAGIWEVKNLLRVLRKGWSPWNTELQGTSVVAASSLRVVGTKQCPVTYGNIFNNARGGPDFTGMPAPLMKELKEKGLIQKFK